MLANVTRRDDFIPEIQRPGPVAEEEDDGLSGIDGRLERALGPAGGVEDQRVGLGEVRQGGQLVRVPHAGHGEELDGEVGLGLQFRQVRLDAAEFGVGVGLGLDAAPRPPTALFAPTVGGVGQDGFDNEGFAGRGGLGGLGGGLADGRVGAAGQRGRSKRHARRLEELTARDAVRIVPGGAHTTPSLVGRTTRRRIGSSHRTPSLPGPGSSFGGRTEDGAFSDPAGGRSGPAPVYGLRGGTSSHRRSCHDLRATSANWTPLAPSSRFHGKGSSAATCRRNNSHWTLKAPS